MTDPSRMRNTLLLIEAARVGDAAEVERLIPLSVPSFNCDKALRVAAENGNTECLTLLLPYSVLLNTDAVPLLLAAENGHVECVKMLAPFLAGGLEAWNQALFAATCAGHAECVRFLVARAQPQDKNSRALMAAVIYEHSACVDILYPHSDPVEALDELVRLRPKYSGAEEQLRAVIARHQRAVIAQVVGERETGAARKL